MYDITKTRMLMTTAVFAAVTAVFAGGANARIPGEDGSNFEGQLSIVHVVSAQVPSWRGKGGKGEETMGATDTGVLSVGAQVPSWRGKGGKGEETSGATAPWGRHASWQRSNLQLSSRSLEGEPHLGARAGRDGHSGQPAGDRQAPAVEQAQPLFSL